MQFYRKKSHTYTVQFSCSVMYYSLRPHELQHARPPCPSPTPRVHSNPFDHLVTAFTDKVRKQNNNKKKQNYDQLEEVVSAS